MAKRHSPSRTQRNKSPKSRSHLRFRSFHPFFQTADESERGDIREIYSDAVVDRLCAEYQIKSDMQIKALWNFLTFGATIYLFENARHRRPTRGQVRSQLAEVAALARKLSLALAGLHAEANAALWSPEQYIDYRITEPTSTTEFGLTVRRQQTGEGTFQLHYLGHAEIIEAVSALANYASHSAKQLPKDRSGAKSDFALWMWVVNAQAFWREQLGRRFTYERHGAEPVSEAFRFCWDAIHPLDPDVPLSAVGSTMRKAIKFERRRTGKNPFEK